MGLDAVELILSVEERFGISISDLEAEQTRTVGNLLDLVMTKVNVGCEPVCSTQRAFHLLRRSTLKEFSVCRSEIRLRTYLDQLLPRRERRESWLRLRDSVGAATWPELTRERWSVLLVAGCTFAAFVLTYCYSHAWDSLPNVFLSTLAATAVAWLGERATCPWKTVIPSEHATVSKLVQYIVAHNSYLVTQESDTWTRERAGCVLREIILEYTTVCDFDENSSFVEDLELG